MRTSRSDCTRGVRLLLSECADVVEPASDSLLLCHEAMDSSRSEISVDIESSEEVDDEESERIEARDARGCGCAACALMSSSVTLMFAKRASGLSGTCHIVLPLGDDVCPSLVESCSQSASLRVSSFIHGVGARRTLTGMIQSSSKDPGMIASGYQRRGSAESSNEMRCGMLLATPSIV